MATRSLRWVALPFDATAFAYPGAALAKAWPALHAGDLEPWPDHARAAALLKAGGKAAPRIDAAALASALQEAWRAFHRGDFQAAYEQGEALGPIGASVAVKALGIHATHLVSGEADRIKRFQLGAELAEAALVTLPKEANSHYRLAFALGRYSQGISILKALQQGIAGRVRKALDETLKLAPKHAEAHTAMALYHGEIVAKVGGMLAGLTYGAKATEAVKHMQAALKLTPAAPIVHLEHGNLLLLQGGATSEDAAADAYERAATCKPRDAMEALDAAHARSLIE
jgi:hypothetical protein